MVCFTGEQVKMVHDVKQDLMKMKLNADHSGVKATILLLLTNVLEDKSKLSSYTPFKPQLHAPQPFRVAPSDPRGKCSSWLSLSSDPALKRELPICWNAAKPTAGQCL